MNRVTEIMGLSFLRVGKARDSVMRTCLGKASDDSESKRMKGESEIISFDFIKHPFGSSDDDETASLTSGSDDSTMCIVFEQTTVRFAPEHTTEVHYRPFTTAEEKEKLFYSGEDYVIFRLESRMQRLQLESIGVARFAEQPVERIHEYDQGDCSELYYSQSDLQRYVYVLFA